MAPQNLPASTRSNGVHGLVTVICMPHMGAEPMGVATGGGGGLQLRHLIASAKVCATSMCGRVGGWEWRGKGLLGEACWGQTCCKCKRR